MADLDDDVIPFSGETPKYEWFERSAPPVKFTLALFVVALVMMLWHYYQRVKTLKQKFGGSFKGSLRTCALISAYMDNYGFSRFATLKLYTKSLLFLALLQQNFHAGFWIMWGILVVESSLDTVRVLLAYVNCTHLDKAQALSDEEAKHLETESTKSVLNPTNVYEDLTRHQSLATMVFMVQAFLIGLVMDDTYRTETRTCFNGTDGCPMLTSLGSYVLYLLGTFMACVFYIGPRNAYGQKEQNPTFWLKLFLLTKQPSRVSWTDSVTGQMDSFVLHSNDWRIWLRFILSFVVNGIGFHFLLHVLPIQVAGQSTIIGVVFRAIGMIYLADLDDCTGSPMTVSHLNYAEGNGKNSDYCSTIDSAELDKEKQRIIDEALENVKSQLETLLQGKDIQKKSRRSLGIFSITGALWHYSDKSSKKDDDANEETPLV